MKDLDFNKIFGVEAEKGPEAADPDETTVEENESGKEPDVADQDEIESNDEPEEYDETEVNDEAEDGEGDAGQSDEDNKKFAAARRKAEKERDEAIASARLQARKEAEEALDATIKEMGLVDPYTQKPIETQAELTEYNRKLNEERRAELQKKARLSDDEMETFLAGQPEVREARRITAEAQAALRDAEEQKTKAIVDRQIEMIGKIDPSIKTVEDLIKMDNYQQFREAVEKHHLDFYDAFRFVNMDRLTAQQSSAAKQAAINRVNGKSHMTKTGPHGKGNYPEVPKDVVKQYKMFMPDISDEEIRKDYARNHKDE